MKETCLSHQTIGRRINDLCEDIEGKLKDYLSTCDHYSLALDESTIKVILHNWLFLSEELMKT